MSQQQKIENVRQFPIGPARRKLPEERKAITHKFDIAGYEGYVTVGLYADGMPGEVFIVMAKEGSTISGFADAWAQAMSISLQYGVPLEVLVEKFSHVRFEPSGVTKNPDVRFAKSIVDYIARWMAAKFLNQTIPSVRIVEPVSIPKLETPPQQEETPPCNTCGTITVRAGQGFKCLNCGSTTGYV